MRTTSARESQSAPTRQTVMGKRSRQLKRMTKWRLTLNMKRNCSKSNKFGPDFQIFESRYKARKLILDATISKVRFHAKISFFLWNGDRQPQSDFGTVIQTKIVKCSSGFLCRMTHHRVMTSSSRNIGFSQRPTLRAYFTSYLGDESSDTKILSTALHIFRLDNSG